jgi:hypothetical protein
MGEKEIRSKLEEDLYSKLCNRLPGGIDYAGEEGTEDLIVTDDDGETEYLIEVEVILTQIKPEPEWMNKVRGMTPKKLPDDVDTKGLT